MAKPKWNKFPHPDKSFTYAGAALEKHWARLHRGDCEPFPTDAGVQEAWRAYHAGDFAKAVELGLKAGGTGINAANKAAMIYANYLEEDEDAKLAIFQEIAARCVEQQKTDPKNANAWYYHAYALGRYSQGISIGKALAQGLGGKIKDSLDHALKLAPKHADAHIALGAWHAEIIDKVGPMGNFLTQPHTMRYLKKGEIRISDMWEKRTLDRVTREGPRDLREDARAQVRKLLKDHEPQRLDRDTIRDMDEVVRQATKALVK